MPKKKQLKRHLKLHLIYIIGNNVNVTRRRKRLLILMLFISMFVYMALNHKSTVIELKQDQQKQPNRNNLINKIDRYICECK